MCAYLNLNDLLILSFFFSCPLSCLHNKSTSICSLRTAPYQSNLSFTPYHICSFTQNFQESLLLTFLSFLLILTFTMNTCFWILCSPFASTHYHLFPIILPSGIVYDILYLNDAWTDHPLKTRLRSFNLKINGTTWFYEV